MGFTILTGSKSSLLLNFRTFSSSPKETFHPLAITTIVPSPSAPGNHKATSVAVDLSLLTFQRNGVIKYVTFCVWLHLLSIMFSRFTHIVAAVSTSFMFIAGYYSGYQYTQINYILFVQYGHLVCFHLLAFRASLIAQLVKNLCAMQETPVQFLGREGIGYPLQYSWASLVAQLVRNSPAMQGTWVQSLGWEDPLEKGKATHFSILPWRIPWTIYSPWGCKELDTSEPLSLNFTLKLKKKLQEED